MRSKSKVESRKSKVLVSIIKGFGLLFYLLPFTFYLTSCSKDEQPPIPRAKMETILYDVQTAEVYSTMAGKDSTKDFGQKNEDSLAVYYASIFRHYKINAEQFKTAVAWYRAHPAELDSVYAKLLPKIEAGVR